MVARFRFSFSFNLLVTTSLAEFYPMMGRDLERVQTYDTYSLKTLSSEVCTILEITRYPAACDKIDQYDALYEGIS